MRDRQLKLESGYFEQTTLNSFLMNLERNQDATILVELCSLVESSIQKRYENTQRKRSSFFKITKDLDHKTVAFIGVKVLISNLVMCTSLPVTFLGKKMGAELLTSVGRSDEIFSNAQKDVTDMASAGIMLLDLVLEALIPLKLFRAEVERISRSLSVWKVTSTPKWEELVGENTQLFATISAKRMPMICTPDDWKGMIGGGYLSETGKSLTPLVKGKHKHESPSDDRIFRAINHMQSTPHRINQRIFKLYRMLQAIRPDEMNKLFINKLPDSFKEECPISKEDSYIWEKVLGKKIDIKTGKEKEAMVLSHKDEESNTKRKEFFKWLDRKEAYIKKVAGKKSLDRALDATISVTDVFKNEDNIYWPYSLDSRSRIYPSAMSGINLQGSDYQKAVLEFSVGLPLDFDGDGEGGEYGIIKTVCNHWGNDSGNGTKTDKLTEHQARQWIKVNSEWIIECATSPLENTQWMSADKPLQFLAAAFEWKSWREYFAKNGDYKFISHLPDPNDASCSGAQILSAMTRDSVGAKYTNLCSSPHAEDLYMAVAGKVLDNLLEVFSGDQMAQDWLGRENVLNRLQGVLDGKGDDILSDRTQDMIINRSEDYKTLEDLYLNVYLDFDRLEQVRLSLIIRNLVKKPVMVKFYSGTRYGNIQHCSEFIVEKNWEDNFRCEGTGQAASYMGNLIFDSINQVITGAGKVMEWFIHVADILGNCGKPVKHTTPMGFPMTMAKYKVKKVIIKVVFLGKPRQFTLKIPKVEEDLNGVMRRVLDVSKMKSGIAPDIVHGTDASLIQAVSLRCEKEKINHLLMIHDSLASHCCYTRRFNRIIREEFVKMFEEDLLQNMYEEFKDQLDVEHKHLLLSPLQFGIERGDYDLKEMLDSVHCFK